MAASGGGGGGVAAGRRDSSGSQAGQVEADGGGRKGGTAEERRLARRTALPSEGAARRALGAPSVGGRRASQAAGGSGQREAEEAATATWQRLSKANIRSYGRGGRQDEARASGSVFLGVCGADDVARACVFPFEAPRLGLLRRPPPARCPPVCVIGGVQWTPPPTPTLRWGRCQFLRECFVLPRVGTVGPMLKSNQCDVPQSLFRVTAPSCVPPSVDVSLAVRCLKCSDLGSCV